MSGYHGRTGPNFSHYINNLNARHQSYEQDIFPPDDLKLDQELALFTNTDFTDFDSVGTLPDKVLNYGVGGNDETSDRDFKYEELLANATLSHDAEATNVSYYSSYPSAIPSTFSGTKFPKTVAYSSPGNSPSSREDSLLEPASAKRKAESITVPSPQQVVSDQQSRLAAEEDKRRRNTAASARFRVKKKQREQALERTVKEVRDQNAALEAKIVQVEMENGWLKNLIIEKNGKQTEEEIANAYQEFRRESEERETSKNAELTKGVGTSS